ncbi:thiamine pyrophosphate-binding protein [Virgibacillus alimentarius]|uniref:thiamine pyrophosphate-binding protein n=1 Tax=Virgibacillus alimentarius TaxID=698769 RepID=UPI000492F79E|nr:thiamine pyrophosphate-binding protein [Virgibacillus alimentarius]
MNQYIKRLTAAQAIVECLRNAAIDKVFCVPGESYLPVLDALYEEKSMDVIATRHEGGASFMAEGYGKATKKPGVVMATRGVGAANLAIGVHTAYQDSTPMVVLLGQVHSKFRGREGFQEVDLDRFFQPITKWATEVKDPERMPEIMERALRTAQSGRPGPVVISLPEDVLKEVREMQFYQAFQVPRPAPSAAEMNQVEEVLRTAKKPVIIAGGGIKSAGAEAALQQFAEQYHLPVAVAFRRHDVFPNDHPHYIGHLGLGANKDLVRIVQAADVVLVLGSRLSEVTTQDYSLLGPEQKLIHIDMDAATLGKVYPAHLGIVADCREALKVFHQRAPSFQIPWKQWTKDAHAFYEQSSALDYDESWVINQKIIYELLAHLPDSAIITNDAGNFASWMHRFYRFKQKDTYIGPTSGAMGYGLPAAIGAKLAQPDKVVVSLSGDGGFMMTSQEIETSIRCGVPIVSIVFNNNMYGTIRMHQEMHYPERVVATDLGNVSFSKLAQSMGAAGVTVASAADFKTALQKALNRETTTVIEVITEKEEISAGKTIQSIRDSKK